MLPRINQIGDGGRVGVEEEGKDPWKIDLVVSSDLQYPMQRLG